MSWHYDSAGRNQRGTRAQSVFNQRTYAMPVRRLEPVYVPVRTTKYAGIHDYGIEDSINRADFLSNAVLEDTFEAAARSRGKDHALLRNLNAAIVNTELHVNPRVAAVSRRVRASSVPPVMRPYPGQQFYPPPPPQQYYPPPQQYYPPPQQYVQEDVFYRTPTSTGLYASRPPLRHNPPHVFHPRRVAIPHSGRSVQKPRPASGNWRITRPAFVPTPLPVYLPSLEISKPKAEPLPPVKIQAPKPAPKVPATPSTLSVGGSSVGGDPNNKPMSDLRRKLRRTIAKAKNNPDYYRE